jgi:peptidoglycan/LPS O-acetylase OafA/YrhL
MERSEHVQQTIRSLSGTGRLRPMLRSIGAVFAGLLVIVALSLGTDTILHATGIYPPWFQPMDTHLWVLALVYRIVYGVAGGYITARVAPARPIRHAMILGVIGLVLSLLGAMGTWNKGPEYGPKWFLLALIAIAVPCSWAGGKLHENRQKNEYV